MTDSWELVLMATSTLAVNTAQAQVQHEVATPVVSFAVDVDAGLPGGPNARRSAGAQLVRGNWGLGMRVAGADTKRDEHTLIEASGSTSHPHESWFEWAVLMERVLRPGKHQLVTLGAGVSRISGTGIRGGPNVEECGPQGLPWGPWGCSPRDYEEVRVDNRIGAMVQASYRLVILEDDDSYAYDLVVSVRITQERALSGLSIGAGWRVGGVPVRR